MSKCVAEVHVTRHSIQGLTQTSTVEEIELITNNLETAFNAYERSNNVTLGCATDLFDYEDNGRSLEDELLEAAGDWGTYQSYLNELEKVTTAYTEFNNTEGMIALIEYQEQQESTFPRHYAFILGNAGQWPTIDQAVHTHCWSNTLTLNSTFIATNHANGKQFIEWSKINYEFLGFDSKVEDTLYTIQVGQYSNYKYLLSHAMDSLNQSYHFVSTDPQNNEDDLDVIAGHTGRIGKTLMCSRQGSSKVYGEFLKIDAIDENDTESINCEYHLKINWNDAGIPIPRGEGNPVRVYFGLKTYAEFERKQFKLAHLGKHL